MADRYLGDAVHGCDDCSVQAVGDLIDQTTQRWVKRTGRQIDFAEFPWLQGPVGQPGQAAGEWLSTEADLPGRRLVEGGGRRLVPIGFTKSQQRSQPDPSEVLRRPVQPNTIWIPSGETNLSHPAKLPISVALLRDRVDRDDLRPALDGLVEQVSTIRSRQECNRSGPLIADGESADLRRVQKMIVAPPKIDAAKQQR